MIKPTGGAIKNPPTALNSINETINTFAKVALLADDRRNDRTLFMLLQTTPKHGLRLNSAKRLE